MMTRYGGRLEYLLGIGAVLGLIIENTKCSLYNTRGSLK